ncbi:SEL1-like repeat protein [Pedomonas mirosovicensis]|uniref:SEL1-like repeat protein n=1 Tax=Pedomonas mirosovicensis TaxID=2908641 RepID=UPI00216AA4A4|nr:SEL1-like repeat protein [Pedomonas mirosovicensis]MCH8685946.1 SEL1-like repeat protein [Pedomonas mirosovicensis]
MPGMTPSAIASTTSSHLQSNAERSDAVERLLAAAKRGEAQAYYDLGTAYALGEGVDIDLIEAHRWYNLAAMAGLREAQAERAALAADMNPAEIAEAQRRAREWLAAIGN